jgi:hypothetical protein
MVFGVVRATQFSAINMVSYADMGPATLSREPVSAASRSS